MLLNNEWVNNKIKKEIKTHLETKENDHTTTRMKSMGHSESSPEREDNQHHRNTEDYKAIL